MVGRVGAAVCTPGVQDPCYVGTRATRSKPAADKRSVSRRGGNAAASQSLRTTRCRPGASVWLAGRCVWPWISVCAPAACSQAMLRAAGFSIEAVPEPEVYLCRVAPVPYAQHGPAAVYPAKGTAA